MKNNFEILARSKDEHLYCFSLFCEEKDIKKLFKEHINEINYDTYRYKILRIEKKEVKHPPIHQK